MKIFSTTRQLFAFSTLLFIPVAITAQENKKEVHIKITENGIVTKDTTYSSSIDSLDMEHFFVSEESHSNMGKKHIVEKRVILKSDDLDSEEPQEKNTGEQKEVTVTVHSGDGPGMKHEVEEIWIDGNGAPCHTIIIHEGDCPQDKMEMNHMEKEGKNSGHMVHSTAPPSHAYDSDKAVIVEKKVIKTGDGDKVIIIETSDDSKPKEKDRKSK